MIVYEGGEHLGLQKAGQEPQVGLNLHIKQRQVSHLIDYRRSLVLHKHGQNARQFLSSFFTTCYFLGLKNTGQEPQVGLSLHIEQRKITITILSRSIGSGSCIFRYWDPDHPYNCVVFVRERS